MEIMFENCCFFEAASLTTGDRYITNALSDFETQSHKRRFERSVGIMGHYEQTNGSVLNLSFNAINNLKMARGQSLSEIGSIIFMSQTPQIQLPSNSVLLQGLLDLNSDVYCLDLNQGCSGFNYSYDLARHRVRVSSKSVLVVHSDCYQSRIEDISNTKLLFSDVAFAYLITPEQEKQLELVDQLYWHDGNKATTMHCSNDTWLEEQININSDGRIHMNGPEIYNFAIEEVSKKIINFLAQNKLSPRDLAKVYIHQANKQLLEALLALCDFEQETVPMNVSKYSNTISASIPILIAEDAFMFEDNQKILVVGFGVGLSVSMQLYNYIG